jgi:hypothetical protein
MSNKLRGERAAGLISNRTHITPADQLKTLHLYIRYQNSNLVGRVLGISGSAVRDRLYAMGIKLRPPGYNTVDVVTLNGKDFLLQAIRELKAAASDPARQKAPAGPWTNEEDALLGSGLAVSELEQLLGRSHRAVYLRRYHLRRSALGGLGRVTARQTGPVTAVVGPVFSFRPLRCQISPIRLLLSG